MKTMTTQCGATYVAADGAESAAVCAVASRRPDVAVCDVRLPDAASCTGHTRRGCVCWVDGVSAPFVY